MNSIVLVDDDKDKAKIILDICEPICEALESRPNIHVHHSYHSGLIACLQKAPRLLLLDMSMPTFDIAGTEHGGRSRDFAGRDLMSELDRFQVVVPTIVVTGFDVLGEGSEMRTMEELTQELYDQFGDIFRGTIHYSTSDSTWKISLAERIREVLTEG